MMDARNRIDVEVSSQREDEVFLPPFDPEAAASRLEAAVPELESIHETFEKLQAVSPETMRIYFDV